MEQSNVYNWCLEELSETQVNQVWLAWFNKEWLIFQKCMEYVSMQYIIYSRYNKDQATYTLPLWELKPDFYSIIQLRVAYATDKNGNII